MGDRPGAVDQQLGRDGPKTKAALIAQGGLFLLNSVFFLPATHFVAAQGIKQDVEIAGNANPVGNLHVA